MSSLKSKNNCFKQSIERVASAFLEIHGINGKFSDLKLIIMWWYNSDIDIYPIALNRKWPSNSAITDRFTHPHHEQIRRIVFGWADHWDSYRAYIKLSIEVANLFSKP